MATDGASRPQRLVHEPCVANCPVESLAAGQATQNVVHLVRVDDTDGIDSGNDSDVVVVVVVFGEDEFGG